MKMVNLEQAWNSMSTYAVDFDNVIHTYPGWCDVENNPMDGAFDGLYWIMEELQGAVYIFCARSDSDPADPGCIQAVPRWFKKHSFKYPVYCDLAYKGFWNRTDRVLVTNRKLPAKFYIDDRGIRHSTWINTRNQIETVLRAEGKL
jgi:hypothetical protein